MALSKGDLHLCMENHLAHCDVLREAGFVIVLKKVSAVKFFDFSNREILKEAVWSWQLCVSLELRYSTVKQVLLWQLSIFQHFGFFQISSVINNFPKTVWKNTGTLFLINRLFRV